MDKLVRNVDKWTAGKLNFIGNPAGASLEKTVLNLGEFMDKESTHKNFCSSFAIEAFDFILEQTCMIKKLRKQVESLSVKVIENQDSVIRLQQEVISSVKDAVKTSVEDSVKAEFETYSSVLQSNSNPDFSPIHVREVVRTAVDEQDRSRNLIVFGLTEEVNENLESAVGEVMQQLGEKPRAAVTRLGKVANIGESRNSRPVKVTFTSSLMVSTILSKSKDLKGTTKFSNVFICPDRSLEQRVAHRKLVSELRNKQKEEADKRHFIRGDKVYSVDIDCT